MFEDIEKGISSAEVEKGMFKNEILSNHHVFVVGSYFLPRVYIGSGDIPIRRRERH
jgi:hypothetical protein